MNNFTFIDLFAGIGGFHQALSELGGTCVFASEIDHDCIRVYDANYGIDAAADITKVRAEDIPAHDVLCAGFPCQSFSKAGTQKGFHETRGTLFFDIERILSHRRPHYIILENVRNLVSHDGGNTWSVIQDNLKALGYRTTAAPLVCSPHEFGIPQLRERVYILGKYDPANVSAPLQINVNKPDASPAATVLDLLDSEVDASSYRVSDYEMSVLDMWDDFYQGIDQKTIGFPVWTEYFKSTTPIGDLPRWKQDFIRKNRDLYSRNQEHIDAWLDRNNQLGAITPTHRKFEWQAGTTIGSVWDGLIQFRPSGVRVKRPTAAPALVAMVHVPIVGPLRRRLTPREAARLQSFPDSFMLDAVDQKAYKQLGNSVNVAVVRALAEALIIRDGYPAVGECGEIFGSPLNRPVTEAGSLSPRLR